MMPADAIAMLDRQIAAHGQKVTVLRYADPTDPDLEPEALADVPAFVRVASADEIVGDIQTTASKVVLSPTHIASFWPLLDSDKVMIEGRECAVLPPVRPFFMAGQLVRCELLVAG